jgi:hypothetical protein
MVFTSNSVILNGGSRIKIDVYIPSALLDLDIPDVVWQSAIDKFNAKIHDQISVTSEINGVPTDVIKLESVKDSTDWLRIGAVILILIVKEEDAPAISDIHFTLTGHLTFKPKSDTIDEMVINNITYGGEDSRKFSILSTSVKEIA